MNKQEAIEQINYMDTLNINDKAACQQVDMVIKNQVLDIINQIDEPQKPKVPQVVADWYEEYKDYFEYNLHSLCVDFHERKLQEDLHEWFNVLSNKPIETLVKMKLYGYEVEKEKLYLASFRDTNQYLGWNEKLGEWFMSCSPFTSGVEQTQETWEGVGIWNNPAFEIKEVDE